MFQKSISIAAALLIIVSTAFGSGGDSSFNEILTTAGAVCKGTAFNSQPFDKGPGNRIFTATGFSVAEIFKGVFSSTVRVEHRGGELNGRGEEYCGRPEFKAGEDYLLFICRREDGSLYCSHYIASSDFAYTGFLEQLRQQADALAETGLDLSDQQASLISLRNLLPGSTGYSSRFLHGDRGEPIEYVVDMDDWPSGITSNQALSAVSNAFAAWSATTTLTFEFGGVESFGMAAPDLDNDDGRIYVQLHDNYGYIDPSSTLARGGRSYSYSSSWPDGGLGGRVGTNEFDRTNVGYVVVEHSKTSLSTLSNFEEVLCHELGHVLSLGHSSEDAGESDPELKDATMYYLVHFDGRAAALRQWDTNTVQIIHPLNDTPPYGYDRIIEAITRPVAPAYSTGANQVSVPAYDLQGGASPVLLSDNKYEANGVFTLEDSDTVFFTPAGYYGDNEASPGSYYGICYVRMTDGVNMSPPVSVSVVSFNADGNSDLLQDSWASAYGVSGATADADDDGLTNYEEWLLELDPTNGLSRLEVGLSGTTLSWTAKAQELFQIQSTTNLQAGFSNDGNPTLADSTNETTTIELSAQKFYRIQWLR